MMFRGRDRWLPVELECCAKCRATDAYDCTCAENDPQAKRVTVLYVPVGTGTSEEKCEPNSHPTEPWHKCDCTCN